MGVVSPSKVLVFVVDGLNNMDLAKVLQEVELISSFLSLARYIVLKDRKAANSKQLKSLTTVINKALQNTKTQLERQSATLEEQLLEDEDTSCFAKETVQLRPPRSASLSTPTTVFKKEAFPLPGMAQQDKKDLRSLRQDTETQLMKVHIGLFAVSSLIETLNCNS